ncbi:MAG: DUF3467 domain-containing protein [Bacteroides sp.]|nr:DUF3467 domain-containing protein [Bacteroides sp.]MDD2644768.1 DUF3467 domain-containing protein [Bacteroides sp.]MDD4054473.1 DUF3467 domain-containing protein [Bacteroides sp.]MDD4719444.1 DUF3467 domain-containing protein [Bacteroides sp.]NLI64934.1 DUF3467 domain-containing protein [Bacteroidales bacterium]
MDNYDDDQIKIELDEETALGTYSNLAVITHSSSEFILDFIRVMPGTPKAPVQSRIVLAPEHAKRLMMALGDNIKRYEQALGRIQLPEDANLPPTVNVKGEA